MISPRHRLARLGVLPLLLLLPACGAAPADPATAPGGSSSVPAANVASPAAGSAELNPCSLLTSAEVDEVIGVHDGGRSHAQAESGACRWENPETYHSITVDIGSPGTAASGQLPESDFGNTEPGPDGIRFAFGAGGVAEFVIADRACHLQLANNKSDREQLIRLVGLVRSRMN